MFTERLNAVLGSLHISISELANQIGCDRSNISRIVKGKRVPKPYGKASWKLVSAIYGIAAHSGRTSTLYKLLQNPAEDNAEQFMKQLMAWLFENEISETTVTGANKTAAPYQSFGQRLDTVMRLSKTSNTQLGRYLNTDPSYVSRFRNGLRFPKSNPKIKNRMCLFLLDRILEKRQLGELAAIIGIAPENLNDREEAYTLLYRWLYGTDRNDTPEVEKLIEQIGIIPSELKLPALFIPQDSFREIQQEDNAVYYGATGLQKAVIRFLTKATHIRAKEIFLYSDQPLEWMVSDEAFYQQWKQLMLRCIRSNTLVHIIHNIERNVGEMTNAIKCWLPLYPSGRIRSYCCARRQDARFSTAIFLCPGVACVTGVNVMGAESRLGVYRYETDANIILSYRRMYDTLLEESTPLLKVCRREKMMKSEIGFSAENTVLTGQLSLATMPQQTLLSIMNRSGFSEQLRKEVRILWEHQRNMYLRCFRSSAIHECIPLLPFYQIKADIPFREVYYTKEEYTAHLRNLVTLSEKYPGYRLYPLTEPAFDRVSIRASQDSVIISRLTEPYYTFVFENPQLCAAFRAYADGIKAAYLLDKRLLGRRIEAFIAGDITPPDT